MPHDYECLQQQAPGEPLAPSNFQRAAFRLQASEGPEPLNGLLVLVPGSNGDGRGMVEEPSWQAFAQEHRLGLIGCWFTDHPHENMNIEQYAKADEGSGQALLDAITAFAGQAGHAELTTVPLLMWGHSAGGQFNYEFACWRPERVAAFVVNKGGFYYTHLATQACRQVPGLFMIGQQDAEFRQWSVKGIFAVNRQAGARWAWAEEPGVGHEEGKTPELARAFFAGVLQRHRAGAQDEGGWLGDLGTKRVYPPMQEFRGVGLTAWLPTETAAQAWQQFVQG